jgi:hypothetical protein
LAERVYTYVDFFDRPLSGAADFKGGPHWYRCQFNDAVDEYERSYELAPLRADILAAEVELQDIFLAWHAALIAGETDRSTHPALPSQRARYDALSRIVREFVESADFAVTANATWSHEPWGFGVDWQQISD